MIRISTTTKAPRNSTIIDGRNKTILPPFVNAHVHVKDSENLKEALNTGIFGMLDMFSTDEKANYFRSFNDSPNYASYYSSNVGATPPGGHGTQFGVDIPTIAESLSPSQFIRDRINQNADYIKITHEISMSRLDSIQLKELIDEAHQNNLITVAHISNLKSAIEVINQGADGLAHLWYRNNSIASENDLNLLKEKKTFVIPTLSVITKLISHAEEAGLEESFLKLNEIQSEVKKLYDHGIPILAGTDSPNFNLDFSAQFYKELILLKECGLSEINILKSATTNIYKAFGLKEFDSLKPNSHSSFLLIDGKPHIQIRDILNKKRIWKNGTEITERNN